MIILSSNMEFLVDLYPRHFDTENNHFFYPCQDLFTKEEMDHMHSEFREFDRRMIYERYGKMVAEIEVRKEGSERDQLLIPPGCWH